jgi:hypothetical protein
MGYHALSLFLQPEPTVAGIVTIVTGIWFLFLAKGVV